MVTHRRDGRWSSERCEMYTETKYLALKRICLLKIVTITQTETLGYKSNIWHHCQYLLTACGLVVRVSGYRYRGLGFDSLALTDFSE